MTCGLDQIRDGLKGHFRVQTEFRLHAKDACRVLNKMVEKSSVQSWWTFTKPVWVPGAGVLDEDKGFCNVDDIIVEEDRQETGRPAKRLTREAAAGEKGRGRMSEMW